MDFVSWGYYSQLNGKIKHVPNHQPDQPVSIKVVEHPSNSTGFSHHGNHDFPLLSREVPAISASPGITGWCYAWPSEKYDFVRQLGLRHSQLFLESHSKLYKIPWFQSPPTSFLYTISIPFIFH